MTRIVEKLSNRLRGALRHLWGESFGRCERPVEMAGLRAACHESWPEDPRLLAAWQRLAGSLPTATTFHYPDWQSAIVQVLCKPQRLRLITVWRGAEEMVGLFPMSMRDDGLLETLAPSVTDFLDPLIDPAIEPDVWRIALRMFAQLRSSSHRNVTLHNVRDARACRQMLPTLAHEAGFEFEERAAEYTPVLTLPSTWDEYLATLDAHERKETRRKINKVMTKGNGRVVRCPAEPAEIARTLAYTFDLMEQAPGAKGEDVKRTLRPVLEKAAPPLIAAGQIWLTTLFVNDQPAAVTLQLPYADGPMLYNCGYDNALREWSPGVVLTALTIQKAIESGAGVYDLLRGQEAYKYKMGAVDRPLWMIMLRKV